MRIWNFRNQKNKSRIFVSVLYPDVASASIYRFDWCQIELSASLSFLQKTNANNMCVVNTRPWKSKFGINIPFTCCCCWLLPTQAMMMMMQCRENEWGEIVFINSPQINWSIFELLSSCLSLRPWIHAARMYTRMHTHSDIAHCFALPFRRLSRNKNTTSIRTDQIVLRTRYRRDCMEKHVQRIYFRIMPSRITPPNTIYTNNVRHSTRPLDSRHRLHGNRQKIEMFLCAWFHKEIGWL